MDSPALRRPGGPMYQAPLDQWMSMMTKRGLRLHAFARFAAEYGS